MGITGWLLDTTSIIARNPRYFRTYLKARGRPMWDGTPETAPEQIIEGATPTSAREYREYLDSRQDSPES